MSVPTRRTRRTRVLAAAAAIAAAALTLTACGGGEGVRDEGASAVSEGTPTATSSSTSSPTAAATGAKSGTAGSGGATKGSAAGKNAVGSAGSDDSGPNLTPCSTATTKVTATRVSRPLNHMLLTVTNTGSKNCDLVDYPVAGFEHAQSVPPVIEDSKPQAVVTLAPGESGYAGILLSAADGGGTGGYTARTLDVSFNDDAGHATPSLPAQGVYIDSSLQVTYWQYALDDALAW